MISASDPSTVAMATSTAASTISFTEPERLQGGVELNALEKGVQRTTSFRSGGTSPRLPKAQLYYDHGSSSTTKDKKGDRQQQQNHSDDDRKMASSSSVQEHNSGTTMNMNDDSGSHFTGGGSQFTAGGDCSSERVDAVADELDALEQDVRLKRTNFGVAGFRRFPADGKGSCSYEGDGVASMPGAYAYKNTDRLEETKTPKQFRNMFNMRLAQKERQLDRSHVQLTPSPLQDESELTMLQLEMMARQKEELDQLKEERRRKFLMFGLMGVVILIAIAAVPVGVKLSQRFSAMDDVALVSPLDVSNSQCALSDGNEFTRRYVQLRNVIVDAQPNVSTEIDTTRTPARVALCWLADFDTFPLPDVVRGQDTYELMQRFTLAHIYYHFVQTNKTDAHKSNGLARSNWLDPTRECDWDYLDCFGGNANVVEAAQLANLDLDGSIPTTLADLTHLKSVSIANNPLSGSIPTALWSMTQLMKLRLGHNNLSGTISSDLGNLESLESLSIEHNRLTGTLPDFGTLTKLTHLAIVSNHAITGTIPDVTNLSKLKELYLFELSTSFTLATSIGLLTDLESVRLQLVGLKSTIPTEIGLLTNLVQFETNHSELSGTIPTELALLTVLESLMFRNSVGLTGSMPDEVCLLRVSSLQSLVAPCRIECPCCTDCAGGVCRRGTFLCCANCAA